MLIGFDCVNDVADYKLIGAVRNHGSQYHVLFLFYQTYRTSSTEPRIQFKPFGYYEVVEPMSNWEIDKTTLVINLTVEGDLRFTTHVTYYTVDGTGIQRVNYVPVSSSCSRGPDTSPFVLISIDILADRASDSDHSFFLVAVYNSTLSTEAQYGNISATIFVRNREPDGVYFPALPIVTALSNLTNQTTSRALVCLTVSFK